MITSELFEPHYNNQLQRHPGAADGAANHLNIAAVEANLS